NGRPCSAHTKFTAYTILYHGGDFKLAARALAKAGFGDRRPSAQGNVQVGEETAPTGYAIILAHFQKKHGPAFRREGVIMSGPEKRPIKQGEACAGAGIELIEELARASDRPRNSDGTLKRSALPYFFRTWAPIAWADFRDGLPDEESAEELSD